MRPLVMLAFLWLTASDAVPLEEEPREPSEAARPEASSERSEEAERRRDSFVPSERIGAETTVSFPADI